MRSLLKTSLFALGLVGTALAAEASRTDTKIPFGELTAEFLAAHKLKDATPESTTFDALVDGPTYVRATLGVFELRYPATHLADGAHADEFRTIGDALLSYQAKWLDWIAPSHPRFKEGKADIASLQKWVKTWTAPALAGASRSGEVDLLVALHATKTTMDTASRFAELMRSGDLLGVKLQATEGERLVFAPDRKEYLGIVGFLGWRDPATRAEFWQDPQAGWTTAWGGTTQILALEYPAWPVDVARPARGASMNELEKTGLLQHVLQRASSSLFLHYFGVNDALFFELGNATNLVIAVLGENNVRTGGAVLKTSGNTTAPYERFVPGGNPSGGTLPPNSAAPGVTEDKPLWRTTVGRDYFTKPLRRGQVLGALEVAKDKSKNKDKTAHFLITSQSKLEKRAVSAPFLGAPAEGKKLPPDEFLDDYEDFFRSYTAAFYHWLQSAAVPRDEKASAEKYAELFRQTAARAEGVTFDSVVEKVYGLPLSAADGEKESLEWRFLEWLSKN